MFPCTAITAKMLQSLRQRILLDLRMKSAWLAACVVAAFALLVVRQAESAEPGNAAVPASGKAAGEVRDDNGLKIKLVWCPAGKFKMGSPESDKDAWDWEKPQVDVTLTRGFWLG